MPSRQQINTIPLRKISDFKSRLSGGGARPNLFEVELAFPDAVAIANDVLQKSRFLDAFMSVFRCVLASL